MRVNLIAHSPSPIPVRGSFPLSLTIKPACGLPGEYQYPTDSASLLRMLRAKTDLPATVIERFDEKLHMTPSARLLGVDLSDRVLTEIGYFVD